MTRLRILAALLAGAAWLAPCAPGLADPLPGVPSSAGRAADPDSFLPGEGGYGLYRNARYGTVISYPAGYFRPDPAPDSGDGRRFSSIDGQAWFYVFAQYNAEGLSPVQQSARDAEEHGGASYRAAGQGWYVLSGLRGEEIYYRRVTEDETGLIRVFEIGYPAVRKAEFDAVVGYMAKSFGP